MVNVAVILLILSLGLRVSPFVVVKTRHANDEGYSFHVLQGPTRRLIPSTATLQTLGYEPSTVEEITHKTLSLFQPRGAISELIQKDNSPDEIMRVLLESNRILQGRLLKNITYIGEFINPSVVPFCGRLFLAMGLAWGANYGKEANEHVEYRWLNHSLAPFRIGEEDCFGVSDRLNPLDIGMVGQDPRMIVDGNELVVVFTYRYSRPVSMGMARIFCNHTDKKVHARWYEPSFEYPAESRFDQKNWSPFFYSDAQVKNAVLLIQRINPLTVVRMVMPPEDTYKHAEVVSKANVVTVDWGFGDFRGGTNALRLGHVYIAFFHTSMTLPYKSFKTYFMGAFTFSAQMPFEILSMSPLPILDEQLYEGPWNPLKNRRIDYVPFPSTIFFNGKDRDTLYLSFGFQDHSGYLGSFDVQSLLDSLRPVNGSNWATELQKKHRKR